MSLQSFLGRVFWRKKNWWKNCLIFFGEILQRFFCRHFSLRCFGYACFFKHFLVAVSFGTCWEEIYIQNLFGREFFCRHLGPEKDISTNKNVKKNQSLPQISAEIFSDKNSVPNKLGIKLPSTKTQKKKYLQEIFGEKSLPKDFWINYQPNKLERKKSSKKNLKRQYLRRNLWEIATFFFYIYLPKKLGRETSSQKNLKRQYLRRNLWREITANFPLEKKWKKKIFEKTIWRGSIYEEIFEEKSLPFFFEKIIYQRNLEETNLRKTIWSDSIYEEIFEEKSLFFLIIYQRNLEEKPSKKKRDSIRRNLWREITTNFFLEGKNLRKTIWRESIYEEIEEKALI